MSSKKLIIDNLKQYKDISEQTDRQILIALSLYIYQEFGKPFDLFKLAKILKEEDIVKLISYFDGDDLKLPSKDEYKNLRLLVVCFFLREVQNWEWKDIKNFLNITEEDEFSSISLSKNITKIKNRLNADILNLIGKIDIKDVEQLKNYVIDGDLDG